MNRSWARCKSLTTRTLALAFLFCGVMGVQAANFVLVPQGATWKYSTGADLGTAWSLPSFDDSAWASGAAQLGYGDNDEMTQIPPSPIYPCYYFRTSFNVSDPSQFSQLNLEVLRDDGCIVYLNGQEVARYGMPTGPISYNDWATTTTDYQWDPAVNIPNLLLPGRNVIAAEVHQCNATSSDISLDLRLTGTTQIDVALNSPLADQAAVAQPAILSSTATDPAGGNLNVRFYARIAPPPIPDFTIAVLPDTQYYTAELNGGNKGIFIAQTEWIVANRAALNIVHVAHMGDVTDSGDIDESEWLNAVEAVSRLEVPIENLPYGLPYGLAVGNHDQMVPAGDTELTTFYNRYFGTAHFAGRPYYGGSFDTRNNNHYQIFSASGFDFIIIYLEFAPSSAVLTWADQVLKANPLRRAIVVSHSLLQTSGAWTAQGSPINAALKGNANLFLMLCGHNDGEVVRQDTYNGSTIFTVMADYQDLTAGGNGWMRLLTFSPNNNAIRVSTYSPWLKQSQTDTNSQFSLPWQVSDAAPFTLLQENTEVSSGSETTAIWGNLQPGTTCEWYVTAGNGTETASSEIRRFTVSINNSPTVTLTSPTNGAVHQPGPIILSATASDSDGTVVSLAFYDGATLLGDGSPLTLDAVPVGYHTFTAVATDDDGALTVSAPVTVFIGFAPDAPADLQATDVSSTEVTLTWNDNSGSETAFEVSEETIGVLGTLPANTTSVTVGSLSPSITYSFSVVALNPAGRSAAATLAVTTLTPPPAPVTPANVEAIPVSRDTIQLIWVDCSADEAGFVVERSLNGADWTQVQTTVANAQTWLDQGLSSGTVYYYRVAAFNAGGSSAFTPIVVAAPLIELYAILEATPLGTLTGTRADTLVADGKYESVTEQITGRKGLRTSGLEHTWTFTVTPGKTVVLWLKAFRSASSDNDNFLLSWSTDNLTFVSTGITLPTSPEAGYQSYVLPNTLQGPVYVRVQDTDRVTGNTALDTVSVDHLLIVTDASPIAEPPVAPVLSPVVPGDQTATLSWAPVVGATTYTVWRNGEYVVRVTSATYTDTGLVNGTTYGYKVVAENAFGASVPSNEQTCTPQSIVVPEPPTALRATAAKGKINVTWTQSATPGITQNRVYRSVNGTEFTLLATIPAGAAYSDASVIAGIRYYYYVTARIDTVESAQSNTGTVTAR